MAEIRYLENRHDVIYSAEGGTIWIKFRRLVQNDMSTEVMWSKSKPIWRTFGRIQWHVIPEQRIILHGAAQLVNSLSRFQSHVSYCMVLPNWWIHCHDSRSTCHIAGCSHLAKSMSRSCHIAGCKNSISYIQIRFRHILFFLFLMQFRLWWAAAFVSSAIH